MQMVGSSRLDEFRTFDLDGQPANALLVQFFWQDPSGTVHTQTVAPTATGLYRSVVKFDRPGLWTWWWDGGGAAALDASSSGSAFVFSIVGTVSQPWCSLEDAARVPQIKSLADAGSLDYEALARATMAATEYLAKRSAKQFRGLGIIELRPCCTCSWRTAGYLGGAAWTPWSLAGSAVPLGGDITPVWNESAPCGCSPEQVVLLPADMPDDPSAVLEVLIDGEAFAGWRLDPGRRLVRTDGEAWPCCASLRLPATEVGTFAVRVVAGEEVFQFARLAAAELGAELYLAVANPQECRIPTKVSRVDRQGVTYTQVDTASLTKDGKLGLRATDIFLDGFGEKPRRTIRMASPDVAPDTRRVRS